MEWAKYTYAIRLLFRFDYFPRQYSLLVWILAFWITNKKRKKKIQFDITIWYGFFFTGKFSILIQIYVHSAALWHFSSLLASFSFIFQCILIKYLSWEIRWKKRFAFVWQIVYMALGNANIFPHPLRAHQGYTHQGYALKYWKQHLNNSCNFIWSASLISMLD